MAKKKPIQHVVPRIHLSARDGLLYMQSEEMSRDQAAPPVELILSRNEAAALVGELAKVLAHAWETE